MVFIACSLDACLWRGLALPYPRLLSSTMRPIILTDVYDFCLPYGLAHVQAGAVVQRGFVRGKVVKFCRLYEKAQASLMWLAQMDSGGLARARELANQLLKDKGTVSRTVYMHPDLSIYLATPYNKTRALSRRDKPTIRWPSLDTQTMFHVLFGLLRGPYEFFYGSEEAVDKHGAPLFAAKHSPSTGRQLRPDFDYMHVVEGLPATEDQIKAELEAHNMRYMGHPFNISDTRQAYVRVSNALLGTRIPINEEEEDDEGNNYRHEQYNHNSRQHNMSYAVVGHLPSMVDAEMQERTRIQSIRTHTNLLFLSRDRAAWPAFCNTTTSPEQLREAVNTPPVVASELMKGVNELKQEVLEVKEGISELQQMVAGLHLGGTSDIPPPSPPASPCAVEGAPRRGEFDMALMTPSSAAEAERALGRMMNKQTSSRFRSKEQLQLYLAMREHRRDVMGVLPAGTGKTACYMLPAAAGEPGVSIIISPYVALSSDMEQRAKSYGLVGRCLRWRDRGNDEPRGGVVIVGPTEVLGSAFRAYAGRGMQPGGWIRRVIIDEVHVLCSESDYWPALRALGDVRDQSHVQLVAGTATLSPQLIDTLAKDLRLRDGYLLLRAPTTARPNISYKVG